MSTSTSINVNFTGVTSSFVPNPQPNQRNFVLNTNNLQYLRNWVLASDSLTFNYVTTSIVIPMSQLLAAAISASPNLTYPPVINIQPTSAFATHPTTSYFALSASAETSINYLWYYSSGSFNNIVLTGSNSGSTFGYYTGSQTQALTCSNTAIATQNTASYYCIVSNVAGNTSSSVVTLNIS